MGVFLIRTLPLWVDIGAHDFGGYLACNGIWYMAPTVRFMHDMPYWAYSTADGRNAA